MTFDTFLFDLQTLVFIALVLCLACFASYIIERMR